MEYSRFSLKYYWVWVFIVSVLWQAYSSTCCLEHEKLALLQLKPYFMSKPSLIFSKELNSWDSNGNGDCCMWKRVRCNAAAHVVELSLGSLMPDNTDNFQYNVLNLSLFQPFGELVSLDLSDNWINRTEGNGGYTTWNLTNLEILDIGYNALQQQEVANLVGSLTSLKKLNLSLNCVDDKFPGRELAHLKKLEVLDLSSSYLYGSVLCQELAHLKKLRVLDLSYNSLNGSLPGQGICTLRNLEELKLAFNAFSGNFPKCIWNLTSLRILDLTENSFTGNLPPLISLPSLHSLSISDNSFEGRVSLCYLMNHSRLLETLDLSNNALRLEVGDSSCSPPSKLVLIKLSQCSLSGNISTFPNFLSNLTNIVHLDLSSSGMIGLFPEWLLQNNLNLRYLNLRNNSVAGSLQLPKHSNLKS